MEVEVCKQKGTRGKICPIYIYKKFGSSNLVLKIMDSSTIRTVDGGQAIKNLEWIINLINSMATDIRPGPSLCHGT